MKKFAAHIIAFTLIIQTAFAAMQTTPTDIRVFIDGKKMPAVCLYNTMYIAADDLIYFGYNLKYDENIRTLFLNKTGLPSDTEVPKNAVASLEKTDINLVINGRAVKTLLCAANGKLYVSAAYLSYERDGYDTAQPEKGNYFGMESYWNGDTRTLDIKSISLPTKEEQIKEFSTQDESTSFLSWTETAHWQGSFFDVVRFAQSGTPHGTYFSTKYFADNGVSAYLENIFKLYDFYDSWGHTTTYNEEFRDDKLYFEGTKTDGRTGKYYLDFNTLAIITLEETEPDDSKRTIPKYESPIGKIPQKASFKTTMDGTEIPAWVILNGTYIDADLLLNFGYEKTYLNDRVLLYIKTGKVTQYTAPNVTEPTGSSGAPTVYVDGRSMPTFNTGNINLISTEVWTVLFNKSTVSAKWDAEKNTLEINTNNKMCETFEDAEAYAKNYYNGDDGNEKIIYSGADFSIMICPSEYGTEVFKISSDFNVSCISEIVMNVYSLSFESADSIKVSEDGRKLEFTSSGASYGLDLYNYTLIND